MTGVLTGAWDVFCALHVDIVSMLLKSARLSEYLGSTWICEGVLLLKQRRDFIVCWSSIRVHLCLVWAHSITEPLYLRIECHRLFGSLAHCQHTFTILDYIITADLIRDTEIVIVIVSHRGSLANYLVGNLPFNLRLERSTLRHDLVLHVIQGDLRFLWFIITRTWTHISLLYAYGTKSLFNRPKGSLSFIM